MLQFHIVSEQRQLIAWTEKATGNSFDRSLKQFIIHQQFLKARQQWEKTKMFLYLFEVKACGIVQTVKHFKQRQIEMASIKHSNYSLLLM